MPKVIYPLTQVNLPKEAHKNIQDAHDLASKGVRKADLWVEATAWVLDQVRNNGFSEVITEGFKNEHN